MRRSTFLAAVVAWSASAAIAAADDLTLQLKWTPQAQFAGYFIAQAKGFYDEENLNVTILPGGPDIAPTQVLADGTADVAIEWMPAALVARERGLPIVNFAQPFNGSGLTLACLKQSGVKDLKADLPGKTVGAWFQGNEYSLVAWMNRIGVTAGEVPNGVAILRQTAGIDQLLQKQASCISAMTYNELPELRGAGLADADVVILRNDDPTLEDGLYALQSTLNDPAEQDKLVRFVRASMKGWVYAQRNPGEATEIVARQNPAGLAKSDAQLSAIEAATKLTAGDDWTLDQAAADRTVKALQLGRSEAVISAQPQGAWTSSITDRVRALNHPPQASAPSNAPVP